jgi:hypothetical protein
MWSLRALASASAGAIRMPLVSGAGTFQIGSSVGIGLVNHAHPAPAFVLACFVIDVQEDLRAHKIIAGELSGIQTGLGIRVEMKRDIQSLKRWLGIALVVASFAFYGCLLLVPLSSFSTDRKIALSTLLVILGEGSFWLAVIILGREAIAKYRKVDWRTWLSGWKKKP